VLLPPPLTLPPLPCCRQASANVVLARCRRQAAANVALLRCRHCRSLRAAATALPPSRCAPPPRFALLPPLLMLPPSPNRRQAALDATIQEDAISYISSYQTLTADKNSKSY
jgi:hypothetical protein